MHRTLFGGRPIRDQRFIFCDVSAGSAAEASTQRRILQLTLIRDIGDPKRGQLPDSDLARANVSFRGQAAKFHRGIDAQHPLVRLHPYARPDKLNCTECSASPETALRYVWVADQHIVGSTSRIKPWNFAT